MEVVVGWEPFGSETGYGVSNIQIFPIPAANASKLYLTQRKHRAPGLKVSLCSVEFDCGTISLVFDL
ncbi:hypothetical protein E4U55_007492 [Claviceps digitariae]|nr:hypothetical protein E4U55_007492 [Claviceps digitariae]